MSRTGSPPPDRPTGIGARILAALPAIRKRLGAARDIYEGVFFAPYRAQIHREVRRQRDLFLLAGFSDLLGVPNPMVFYTLELYPELIEQFHEWHLRMGMEHPPEGGFRCC